MRNVTEIDAAMSDSLVDRVWGMLQCVDALEFVAKSQASSPTGWVGKAVGRVEVQLVDSDRLMFLESGSWSTPEGRTIQFSNTFRWSRDGGRIQLEHLRFGPDRPVYLFGLVVGGSDELVSDSPHVCSEDLYAATLNLTDEIRLSWTVTGPAMSESITYRYWSRG